MHDIMNSVLFIIDRRLEFRDISDIDGWLVSKILSIALTIIVSISND